MFKKSAIALAVAGACGATATAQAEEHTSSGFYGFVNVTADYVDASNGGTPSNIFIDPAADGEIHLGDQANSRFGFNGSTDLGNGMTASARIEIGMGTGSFNRGSVKEDAEPWDKRLAWVQLSGNFGALKAGNQWGTLYEYLGYNMYRSHGFGGAGWYEATRHLNDDAFGLRVSDAVEYTYGAGGYGSDPFTFSAQGIFDQSNDGGGTDETLDAYTLAGQGTFGNFSINAAYYGENNAAGEAEPELMGIGVRANITDALYLGVTGMSTDRDDGSDEVTTVTGLATYNFGNGLSGMAGYGQSSDDVDGDLQTIFLQLNKNLGSGTDIYIEAETASRDTAGPDGESNVIAVGMKKSF